MSSWSVPAELEAMQRYTPDTKASATVRTPTVYRKQKHPHEQTSTWHIMKKQARTLVHVCVCEVGRVRLVTSATDGRNHIFHEPTEQTIGVSEPDLLPTSTPAGSPTCTPSISINMLWVCVCECV